MKDQSAEPNKDKVSVEDKITSLEDILGKRTSFEGKDDELDKNVSSVKKNLNPNQDEEENIENEPIKAKNTKPVKDEDDDTEGNDVSEELTQLRSELEKSEARNKKSHSLVSEVSRKLKIFEKKVNKFLEEGILQEEEANSLLRETEHDEVNPIEFENNPVKKLFKIANEGFSKIKESMDEGLLDEDPLFDKKASAFNSYWDDSTESERKKLYESLIKFNHEPIKMAKKMIALGQAYYEEIYGELEEAGSLRGFKQKYQTQIEALQKTIDKQEKQILKYKEQYEDYVPPKTMKLPNGGGKESHEEEPTSLTQIFDMSKAGTLARS